MSNEERKDYNEATTELLKQLPMMRLIEFVYDLDYFDEDNGEQDIFYATHIFFTIHN